MSSTSNVQNLLVNVFRPTYTYGSSTGYVPSLVFSNVDTIISKTLVTSNANINDGGNNVYIGSNAGNVFSNLRGSSNNVAIGYNAGNLMSNALSNVILGYNAFTGPLSNVLNTIAIGTNVLGGGSNNIYIGTTTGSTGNSNIFIGNGITPGNVSNQLRIGSAFFGDLTNKYIGINNTAPITSFDVSGDSYFRGKMGVQVPYPDKTLDVNGQTQSSGGFLSAQGKIDISGNGILGNVRRGVMLVSAVDVSTSSQRANYTLFAYTLSNATEVNSNTSGGVTVDLSGTQLRLNKSGLNTFDYMITYFPLDTA